MTTKIIDESEKKSYTVTQFCSGKGKVKYQITQTYAKMGLEDFGMKDELRHIFGFVQLSKKDLKYILEQIEKNE